MIWNTKTAGRRVVRMALERKFDSGDLRLQALIHGVPVYQSFRQSYGFTILPTQEFRGLYPLVAPNAFFSDSKWQVLLSGNRYTLKFESGDLRLFSNFGKGLKQYWSLNKALAKNHDLRSASHASIVPGVGGIGLYDPWGKLVWTTGRIRNAQSNARDSYFGVGPDGNLRTYVLQKGQIWKRDFEAIRNLCDLPNSCGPYGVCSNGKCSCLPGWVPNKPKDLTQGCRRSVPFKKCIPGSKVKTPLLTYTGYDTVYNQFKTPFKTRNTEECERICISYSCKCVAFFFQPGALLGWCYLADELRTLKKVANTKLSMHIRI